WVEAYENGRWTAFDPTPWQSRDAALGIERKPGLAGAVFGAIASALRHFWSAPGETLGRLARSPVTLSIGALLLIWLVARRFRRRAPRERSGKAGRFETDPRLATAYARYLKALGLKPRPSETDDELLARLGGDLSAARQFLAAYRLARYRGGPIDEAALTRAIKECSRRGA